jgi:hypothetical protein
MPRIYEAATVYLANELGFTRGDETDILWVGVFHHIDPNNVPTYADFTEVDLIAPPSPLADGTKVDVLSKIGPGLATVVPAVPAGHVALAGSGDPENPIDYQRWVGWRTADEFDFEPVDVVEVV